LESYTSLKTLIYYYTRLLILFVRLKYLLIFPWKENCIAIYFAEQLLGATAVIYGFAFVFREGIWDTVVE